MKDEKNLLIRNSTAEFLTCELQSQQDSIEVRYEDETIWLTQKMMSMLFDVSIKTINEHLQNIYASGELEKEATVRKFRIVQIEGARQVARDVDHYNLDAVISVGYRVNSIKATVFRRWATQVLKHFAIRGYVIDKKRMENGAYLGEDYFERLLEEIREIRLSERRFYQKVTDIYATRVDYDPKSSISKQFFATVQTKLHFAVTGNTAGENFFPLVGSQKENKGFTSFAGSPHGQNISTSTKDPKNYLFTAQLD